MSKVLFTGDSVPILVNLTTDGMAAAISPSATVTAGLVDVEGRLLAGPWTVTDTGTGSNWSTGAVVVNVDGDDTASLMPQIVYVEVQVVSGGTTVTRRASGGIRLTRAGLP